MKKVTFPWPPKELSPNQKSHWAKKAKFAKQYRLTCWALAKEAKLETSKEGKVYLEITFFPPDKRHRDADNMVASIKAGLDGLADALQVNDRMFLPTFKFTDEVAGMVKIEIK
jgi:crossover junction endodeoxyribonuclease RusA